MIRAARAIALASTILVSPLAAAQPPGKAEIGAWGVDTAGLSKTVRPGDDFYTYVNEAWARTATIPTGLPSIDEFTRLALESEQKSKAIVASLVSAPQKPGTDAQRIADLYRSVLDEARLDRLGLDPIRADLDAIAALRDKAAAARLMAQPWQAGVIDSGVMTDARDPQRYIAVVGQGSTALPSPDFYLKPGPPYDGIRAALRAYMTECFRKAGYSEPDERADRVLALETEIAKVSWTPQQFRDAEKMTHHMTIAELKAFAPGFEWDAYLAAHGFAGQRVLNVSMDTAVQKLAALFAATPLATWQDFLAFHTLDTWSVNLGSDWQKLSFGFHYTTLMGIPAQRPLELRAVAKTGAMFGEPIGRIYVERNFPAAYRAQVSDMVGYIRAAFERRIGALEWMDAATKAEARAKLEAVTYAIGYPDRWRDYSGLVIRPDDLVGNVRRYMEWQRADDLRKLGERRRDWEWPYSPQDANAGYIQSRNSITFPAGILRPPFFDPHADPAVNFGGIAAVIGHEFGHGFDDQGSRYDGTGKLRDWWTPQSRAEFEKRTANLVAQYDRYEVVPGAFINGRQNLGENIGDLGGASIALDAYQHFVRDKQGGKAPVIDGFTGEQRFFLAWAQLWRNLSSPEEARRLVLTDNHSAGKFRANGVVRNMDAWYDAFGIKPGDALYLPPEQRVRIW